MIARTATVPVTATMMNEADAAFFIADLAASGLSILGQSEFMAAYVPYSGTMPSNYVGRYLGMALKVCRSNSANLACRSDMSSFLTDASAKLYFSESRTICFSSA